MFKLIFRLMIILIFVMVSTIFIGFFQLVRTESGYHLIRKKEFGLSVQVVDTRDWNILDWARNSDISTAIADIKLKELRNKAEDGWRDFTKRSEQWLDDLGTKAEESAVKKRIDVLQSEAKKRYDTLSEQLQKEKIDRKTFEQNLNDLEAWFQKQVDKLSK